MPLQKNNMRLDLFLVEKGYFKTRSKAKLALDEGQVLVNGKKEKASYDAKEDDLIELVNVNPYVSRGGLKLEGAINSFRLDFKDKVILDIGASTGGFTDCSLKHGAKLVYAVDVGTLQLDESLRNNPKVISYEQTNIKDIDHFDNDIDYLVMDVSFVSIEHLLPSLDHLITDNNALICLIKPQFELGHLNMKNGIVKDKKLHMKVLNNVFEELKLYNLGIYKLIESPILGGSGNKEFLALIKRGINLNINLNSVLK